jgi:hypothetical protein
VVVQYFFHLVERPGNAGGSWDFILYVPINNTWAFAIMKN